MSKEQDKQTEEEDEEVFLSAQVQQRKKERMTDSVFLCVFFFVHRVFIHTHNLKIKMLKFTVTYYLESYEES